MRISQILERKRREVVAASPDASVATAIATMQRQRVGSVVVVDESSNLLGIVSERDVVRNLGSKGAMLLEYPVSQIMRTAVPVATLTDSVQSVMRAMTESRASHVPVLEGTRVIGVVSIGDILKSRLEEKTEENGVLQELARAHVLVS